MTKRRTRREGSFAELAESVERLREAQRAVGMPDELVDEMLRDAEDGAALGLGEVPPAYPAKYKLDARARVELMAALSTLATAVRERVRETEVRTSAKRAA